MRVARILHLLSSINNCNTTRSLHCYTAIHTLGHYCSESLELYKILRPVRVGHFVRSGDVHHRSNNAWPTFGTARRKVMGPLGQHRIFDYGPRLFLKAYGPLKH